VFDRRPVLRARDWAVVSWRALGRGEAAARSSA